MKMIVTWGVILVSLLAAPVLAQDAFHVEYRQEDVAVEGNMVSGKLLVSVYNVSGSQARDVAVLIPGPNNVTYDNRAIFIGTLGDGQRVETLDMFSVPGDMRQSDRVDEQASFDVEFTAASGQRIKERVTGRSVQIGK